MEPLHLFLSLLCVLGYVTALRVDCGCIQVVHTHERTKTLGVIVEAGLELYSFLTGLVLRAWYKTLLACW